MDADDNDGWDDQDLGRAIVIGAAVGVPGMFLLATLMVVVGDVAWHTAAGVALVPAFFIGPYLGGLMLMARASARHEHVRPQPPIPVRRPDQRRHAA